MSYRNCWFLPTDRAPCAIVSHESARFDGVAVTIDVNRPAIFSALLEIKMSALTSVVIPLFGVVVGAMGVLSAQYLSTRVSKQQAEIDRRVAVRAERKGALLAFLEATQRVEQTAEERYETGKLPDNFAVHVHDMWFQNRCIMLVSTPDVIEKSQAYVRCLHRAIYRELPNGIDIWQFVKEYFDPFLDAARDELGLDHDDRRLTSTHIADWQEREPGPRS